MEDDSSYLVEAGLEFINVNTGFADSVVAVADCPNVNGFVSSGFGALNEIEAEFSGFAALNENGFESSGFVAP